MRDLALGFHSQQAPRLSGDLIGIRIQGRENGYLLITGYDPRDSMERSEWNQRLKDQFDLIRQGIHALQLVNQTPIIL